MRRAFFRFAATALLAVAVALAHNSVLLLAQTPRPYSGALFWLSPPQDAAPGDLWVDPPVRAEATGGATGTSFPDRVWLRGLRRMPRNDSCHGAGDPLNLPQPPPHTGVPGLQVSQYIGDWWRGLVYEPHLATVGPNTELDFGAFNFAPRADRLAVGTSGLPHRFVGNPGACVAHAIAALNGDFSGGVWRPHSKDVPTGGDCHSASYYLLLRANSELRCEPDFGDQSDLEFTEHFWDHWAYMQAHPSNSDPQGLYIHFPDDYVAHEPFFRRIDVMVYGIPFDSAGSGGTVDVPFTPPGGLPASGDRIADYQRYHPAMFELDPLSGLLRDRNPFRSRDPNGAPTAPTLALFDGRSGMTDCLQWNLSSPGSLWNQTFPCLRTNSVAASNDMVQPSALRVEEAGPVAPARLPVQTVELPVAAPTTVPFVAPPGSTWHEWDAAQFRCSARIIVVRDLIEEANIRIGYWFAERLNATDPAYRLRAERNENGWRRIASYRGTYYIYLPFFAAQSGYTTFRADEALLTGQLTNCTYDSQPLTHVRSEWEAPNVVDNGLYSHSQWLPLPPVPGMPDYWAGTGMLSHDHGVGSPEAFAASSSGDDYPVLVDAAPTFAPNLETYRSFRCDTNLELRSFAPGIGGLTPDFTGVFPRNSVMPRPRGTYEPTDTRFGEYGNTSSGDLDGGVLITWDRERVTRDADYRVSAPFIDLNLVAPVRVDTGLPVLDPRLGGIPGHTLTTSESYRGFAPGTGPPHDMSVVRFPDEEVFNSWGPVRFYGAMQVTSPGGCTLTGDAVYTDFPGAEFVFAVDDQLQNLACLVDAAAVPLGDCPGY